MTSYRRKTFGWCTFFIIAISLLMLSMKVSSFPTCEPSEHTRGPVVALVRELSSVRYANGFRFACVSSHLSIAGRMQGGSTIRKAVHLQKPREGPRRRSFRCEYYSSLACLFLRKSLFIILTAYSLFDVFSFASRTCHTHKQGMHWYIITPSHPFHMKYDT